MQLFWQRHAPGTAPGTLTATRRSAEPVRAWYAEFRADSLSEHELDHPEQVPSATEELTQWLDIEGHDLGFITALGQRLEVHPLALEDVVNVGQRSKAEDFGTAVFAILDHFFIDPEDQTVGKEQVSLIIQPHVLVSARERRSDLFEPVRARLRLGKPRIRGGGTGYLAYALIDTVVDHLFPVLEALGDRIEAIEGALLDAPSPDHVAELHTLRRELLLVRKSVWPLRDMLNGLVRSEQDLFGDETRLYLRDVVDHATMAVDVVETLREMVSSLMDLYLSTVSNRMNEIMKVLTIIATIFIPLSFITGLYGMNFDPEASPYNMPELGWTWGYPAALAVMASVVVGLLVYFRRRGWL